MNNTQDVEVLLHKRAVEAVLINYAKACDKRDWSLLGNVFHPEVKANYNNEFKAGNRDEAVALVSGMLTYCGPTQHLLGNFAVEVDGNQANCTCYVRAAHAATDNENLVYELWGQYLSHLVVIDGQWVIDRHELWLSKETGTRDVLGVEL